MWPATQPALSSTGAADQLAHALAMDRIQLALRQQQQQQQAQQQLQQQLQELQQKQQQGEMGMASAAAAALTAAHLQHLSAASPFASALAQSQSSLPHKQQGLFQPLPAAFLSHKPAGAASFEGAAQLGAPSAAARMAVGGSGMGPAGSSPLVRVTARPLTVDASGAPTGGICSPASPSLDPSAPPRWDEPVKCHVCPRVFATKYQAKKHFLRRHYQGEKQFMCTRCNKKSFTVREDLTMHLKACGRMFVCSCGLHLRSQATLKRHCKHTSHEPTSWDGIPVTPNATSLLDEEREGNSSSTSVDTDLSGVDSPSASRATTPRSSPLVRARNRYREPHPESPLASPASRRTAGTLVADADDDSGGSAGTGALNPSPLRPPAGMSALSPKVAPAPAPEPAAAAEAVAAAIAKKPELGGFTVGAAEMDDGEEGDDAQSAEAEADQATIEEMTANEILDMLYTCL